MKALIFALLVLSQACVSPPPPSQPACDAKLRALIDMGSGSAKLHLGKRNTCPGAVRIRKKLPLDVSIPVRLEASKNEKGEISPEAMQEAIAALYKLREAANNWAKGRNYKNFELAVIGTHALRTAANKDEFLIQIESAGFPVRALTQEEEGLAGFEAVAASTLPDGCAEEDLLVWDVGGGSTQLTRVWAKGKKTANFPLGAENFRKSLLKFRAPSPDPACPQHPGSPNPIGKKNLKLARAQVAKIAPLGAGQLDSKNACVVGISGVHAKAVWAQVQKHWNKVGPCSCGKQPNCLPTPDGYSKKELQCLADLFAVKNDCSLEIKGPYAATAVSNLALVLGFMDQLGVERVHVKSINMGESFLDDDALLKFKTEPVH